MLGTASSCQPAQRTPSGLRTSACSLGSALWPTASRPTASLPICRRLPCPRCGTGTLDWACSHALQCATPEATRGHYEVRDHVLTLAHLADPGAEAEAPGLIPSAPLLRPADVLTSAALVGRLAALDVGVCSPEAQGAGEDCCNAMHARKLDDYRGHLAELAAAGITYVPIVWSAYGRAHPEAQAALRALALRAARRRGLRCHRPLLRRAEAAIGVAIWRRAAAMVHACLPALTPEEERLLWAEASPAREA